MRYPLSDHASLSVRLRRTCWVVLVRTNATATGIDVMLQIEKTFRDLARELHIAEPAALARRGLEDHRGVDNLAELAEVLAQGIDCRNRAQPTDEDLGHLPPLGGLSAPLLPVLSRRTK